MANRSIRFTQFRADLRAFSDQVKKELAEVVVEAGIECFGELIARTPWKTGTARANWNASVGSPDLSTRPKQIYAEFAGKAYSVESKMIARGIAEEVFGPLRDQKEVRPLYIANALDYIEWLDRGNSQQAPSPFVIQVVEEVEQKISAGLK